MKCPACKYKASELRDICPHCMLDLREHKVLHGLEATNPSASYQQLAGLISAGKPKSPLDSSSLKHMTESVLADVEKHPELTQHTEDASTSTIKSEQITETISELEDLVKAAEQEFELGGDPIEEKVKPASSSSPQDVDQLMSELMEESKTPFAAKSETEGKGENESENESETINEGLLQASYSQEEEEERTQIGDFFDFAYESIKSNPKESVELGFEDLGITTPYLEMSLLFDVAYQTAKNPHILEKFNQEIPSSKNVQIDAKKLSVALAEVKKDLDAPVFSLKRKSRSKRPQVRERTEYEFAPRRLRLASALIDALFCLIICFLIKWMIGPIFAPNIPSTFWIPASPDKFAVLGFLLGFLLLTSAIYPMFCLGVYKRTLGIRLTGLQVRRQNDRPLIGPNVFVRSLLMPLSLLIFGYAPLLFKKNPLHDHFAKTKLVVQKTRKILK